MMLDFMHQVLPAIERALITDLPDLEKPQKKGSKERRVRRPHRNEINIYAFPQVWLTPALGFDATGWLENHTAAYTVVVAHEDGVAAVYFGGSFAYLAPVSSDLLDDIGRREMRPVSRRSFYGRVTCNGEEIMETADAAESE